MDKKDYIQKYGLRERDAEPVKYTLSGIILSLNDPPTSGADSPLKDSGHYAPAVYMSFWGRGTFLRNLKNRIHLAFEVLCGRADVLYYK